MRMADRPAYVEAMGDGRWALLVWVQPGAKKDGLAGVADGRLRVRLSAPAVDNKANRGLERYMASLLGVRPARVSVASGQTSRRKRVVIESDAEPDWASLYETMQERNL
ncbi:protein of unknown function DUF167 [Nitratidesulfovibrio vulgaris DP4]|nr:protein of unknown function DUF167 [Nitratidesulfovibrio vulgaris DP4]